MWQDNFLDYPEHYWNESDVKYRKFRQQMRDRYKRINDRVEKYQKEKQCTCPTTKIIGR